MNYKRKVFQLDVLLHKRPLYPWKEFISALISLRLWNVSYDKLLEVQTNITFTPLNRSYMEQLNNIIDIS